MMMAACIKIAGLMGMSPSVGVALLTVLQMACVASTFGYLSIWVTSRLGVSSRWSWLLPQMYEILQTEDYDNVATRRTTRKGEPPIRSFCARMFYKIINRISKADIVDGARDFRLMKRPMVNAIISMGEYNRFSKGIYGWVGFKTKWLPYVNVNRVAGETKWSFWSLLLYSIDGIVAFSTAPLSLAALTGIVFCLIAILGFVVILVKTLVWGDPVGGWPSLACLITLFGGMELLCLGIIGEYLAKAYLETKRRPIYIIRESNEESDDTAQ